MGYEPENTLRSFQKAIELGVDMVELDVHLCKSGELVVIHDEKVDRTTNGKGFVADMTFAELKKLDVGKPGSRFCETILILDEVCDFVDKRVGINIELKGRGTSRPVADVIERYKNKGWSGDLFIVSSFDRKELREFRRYNQDTRIGILFKKRSNDLFDFAKELGAFSIHTSLEEFSIDFMNEARQRGLKVFVWTVNSPTDIRRLINAGIDGIFSDFPDQLKQFV